MVSVDIDHEIQPSCASSDTEPDIDDPPLEDPDLAYPSFLPGAQYGPFIYEKVAQAINYFDQQVASTKTDVLALGSVLIEFLQGFCTLRLGHCYPESALSLYKRIVHISFVHRLFEMRKKYRMTRGTPTLATTVDVCWVDVVLAYLSLASVALASGDPPEEWNASPTGDLSNRRRDNCIFAAVQLPESWSSILSVITSRSSSPAAKTLALRLLFTVHVLGKYLNHYDPCIYDSVDPTKLVATCLEVLHQRVSDSDIMQVTHSTDVQGAVHHSILISLFVTASQSTEMKSQLDLNKPHSLGLLLELIQVVMTYDLHEPVYHISNPRETLNPALIVLMRCSNILPWCWLLWADHRTANFECVVYLTTTWLHHWDTSSLIELDSGSHFVHFIQIYPKPSLLIFQQILLDSADYLNEHRDRAFSNQSFLVVLSKTCWAVCKIMESNSDIDSYVPGLCRYILKIFLLLHSSVNPEALIVKELILGSLVHVDDQKFCAHLKGALAEIPPAMQHMAENAVAKTKSLLKDTRGTAFENDLFHVKNTLCFFIICWHKQYELCILSGTTSTLLNLVADLASLHYSAGPASLSGLVSDMWIALSIIDSRPELAVHMSAKRQEKMWERVIEDTRRRFLIAGSFANFAVTTQVHWDTLQCVGAWNYFSGVFLTIMQCDLVEGEDMGILISPSICLALLKLLRISSPVSRFIRSSPWTISLVDKLQRTLSCHKNCDNVYLRALCCHLTDIGEQLYRELNYILQDKLIGSDGCNGYDLARHKTKLLHLHSRAHSCLLLVPLTSETPKSSLPC